VLFECLAGRPPFHAVREQAVLKMHLEDAAPDIREQRKDVPEGLAMAIEKAVMREREDRWQEAAHMKESLSMASPE
ncbi:MAG: serine/threonine protein kinase, partial [Gemmatimonadetes bacterium]|nr:serine/threonine protein kinase [Gemmatimonadota bacterium]